MNAGIVELVRHTYFVSDDPKIHSECHEESIAHIALGPGQSVRLVREDSNKSTPALVPTDQERDSR